MRSQIAQRLGGSTGTLLERRQLRERFEREHALLGAL
jgi:hypothetical protein